jgi:sporulation protein YqfC
MPQKIRKKLNRIIDLPSEIILNTPKITLDSNEKIWIENFKGLIEFTDSFIRVDTKENTIVIEGNSLSINYMTKEEICIFGIIKSVIYD